MAYIKRIKRMLTVPFQPTEQLRFYVWSFSLTISSLHYSGRSSCAKSDESHGAASLAERLQSGELKDKVLFMPQKSLLLLPEISSSRKI